MGCRLAIALLTQKSGDIYNAVRTEDSGVRTVNIITIIGHRESLSVNMVTVKMVRTDDV